MMIDQMLDGFLALCLLIYTLLCMFVVQRKRNHPSLVIGSDQQLIAISSIATRRSVFPCILRSLVVIVLLWRVFELLFNLGATFPPTVVFISLWGVVLIYNLWMARIITESVYEATRLGFGRK